MAKKPSLGRGFDTLIPTNLDSSILEEDKNRVQKILISDITPNPDQPRREFDKAALSELSSSIKLHGVLQPIIVVRSKNNNGYTIVAGERRYRAAKQADLTHMPAVVRSLKELEQIELSLIENIQRVDLSPLEQALSVYRLQQQFNLALDDIAKKLGKAPSTVSNLSRLLQLPESAKQALRDGKISEGHARAILSLKGDEAKQEELLRSILNNNLTVRQAEQMVIGSKSNKTKVTSEKNDTLSKKLSQVLQTTVTIRPKKQGGQLVIHYIDDEQLNTITSKLQ